MELFKKTTIKRNDFIAKVITDKQEFIEAYKLRYEVYCQELKWKPVSSGKFETDQYDKGSVFLGIFNSKNKIVSFARITQYRFMLDNEYPQLLSPEVKIIKSSNTAEVSRLCVHPSLRSRKIKDTNNNVVGLLFELITLFCKENNIRHIYFVVAPQTHKLILSKGYPVRKLSRTIEMNDKCKVLLATIDFSLYHKSKNIPGSKKFHSHNN